MLLLLIIVILAIAVLTVASFRASDSDSSDALRILPSRCSMKTRNFIRGPRPVS